MREGGHRLPHRKTKSKGQKIILPQTQKASPHKERPRKYPSARKDRESIPPKRKADPKKISRKEKPTQKASSRIESRPRKDPPPEEDLENNTTQRKTVKIAPSKESPRIYPIAKKD